MELLETRSLHEGKHVDFVAKTYRREDGSEVERELAEEAELQAEEWSVLHVVYPSPGFLSEKVTIFEATGLSPAEGERDDDEEIEIVRLDLAQLEEAMSQIRDATTVIALLYLKVKARLG